LIYHLNGSWWGVQNIKFLVMQPIQVFILLGCYADMLYIYLLFGKGYRSCLQE
jgi:hypothetical protein